TRQEIGALPNRAPVTRFEFSPDSKTLAYLVADKSSIFVWDIAAGQQRAVLSGPAKRVTSLHFNPSGTRLVAASADRTVRVLDAREGEPHLVLYGHKDTVENAVFSRDGRRIVSAGRHDRTARLWDAETGKALAILREHDGFVGNAIFNPQGGRVLSGEAYP